ncbi:MAG: trimethylamine methyltransferase family protein [Rhodobacteraceae bacterium]|nr:trimethylamine methyltransferase family protein [Paracoccaceae bacterium]
MRRNRRKRARTRNRTGTPETLAGTEGGRFNPLTLNQVEAINAAAFEILESIGLSGAPIRFIDAVVAAGGQLTGNDRLRFPARLVEEAVAATAGPVHLCGQDPRHDMKLADCRVHTGTGGAAPEIIDLDTGRYRPSNLRDLHDAARLADTLEHVHFFSRPLVARDMPDPELLDINTAYACLAGTAKHVCVSASDPRNVGAIGRMCFAVAGSRAEFLRRPFLSLNVNHVVPPLGFAASACDVLVNAVETGIPVHVNTFGQLGATGPVTLAGTIAQTIAETLAGLTAAWLINPEARVVFGPRPMITDLRTGTMSGGGGEQALLSAASIQMARHYGLANSTIAGATDSKIPDAQSGHEKGLTVATAAHAGANMITQACGMHAGLMGVSLESYVIDNDMLGAVLRSLAPIEVSEETLATDDIANVVAGEGHFLGRAETLRRMETDFLYPEVSDRHPRETWEASGSQNITSVANERVMSCLREHFPSHLDHSIRNRLRQEFDIRLHPACERPA